MMKDHMWIKEISFKKIISPYRLERILKTWKFYNVNLDWYTKLNTQHIKLLSNCHTLDLSNTNITDESVKMLSNCHTLGLNFTFATDESVKMLGNCHTLNLRGMKITDDSVKILGN